MSTNHAYTSAPKKTHYTHYADGREAEEELEIEEQEAEDEEPAWSRGSPSEKKMRRR